MMKQFFACVLMIGCCLALGCGGTPEVKPKAEGPPKDTSVANKGMADMMNNPNMPAAQKEKMKQFMKDQGGAAPATPATSAAPATPETPATTPK